MACVIASAAEKDVPAIRGALVFETNSPAIPKGYKLVYEQNFRRNPPWRIS